MKALRRYAAPLLLAICIGCASDPPRAGGTYTVRKGDTLYSIAWRHGVDYRDLAKWNGIGRDYLIQPGQVLRLASSRNASSARRSNTAERRVASKAPVPVSNIKWSWPTVTRTAELTTRPNGGQGLIIQGALGQEIRAAASGRVVYTGTGLLGYGQLVIVQHDDTFLSAYGHTQAVRVHEQEQVQAGQVIATMGAGPNGAPILYFEIRVDGRPVNPIGLLPR